LGVSPAIVHSMRVRDARAGGLQPPHVTIQGRRSAAISVDVHERDSSCRSTQRSPVLREKLMMASHWPEARTLARSGSSLMMPVPGHWQKKVEGRPGRAGALTGPGPAGGAPDGGVGQPGVSRQVCEGTKLPNLGGGAIEMPPVPVQAPGTQLDPRFWQIGGGGGGGPPIPGKSGVGVGLDPRSPANRGWNGSTPPSPANRGWGRGWGSGVPCPAKPPFTIERNRSP
jgi:hypothetical protein